MPFSSELLHGMTSAFCHAAFFFTCCSEICPNRNVTLNLVMTQHQRRAPLFADVMFSLAEAPETNSTVMDCNGSSAT